MIKKIELMHNQSEVNLFLSESLFKIIDESTPHILIVTEESFISPYNGKISYDYSGKVKKATGEDIRKLELNLGKPECFFIYESRLDELLSNIYINQWIATYTSNYGKRWLSYFELLEDKFQDWKVDNYTLYDEESDNYDDGLDVRLAELFQFFIKNTGHELYFQKIISNIMREE